MMLFHKQSGERLDYDIDLGSELPATDTILTAVPSVTPTGLTLSTTEINNTTKVVKQWISGGADSTEYKVTLLITTSEGRVIDQDFKLRVKDQ